MQLPDTAPSPVLQLAGSSERQDPMDEDNQGSGSAGDSEEYEQSEGSSDFEDAYSEYGTTEEEEENNSIPPADLEAILAENAKLWGQQQQQQQQQQEAY
jgi:hypothetical protein